MTDPAAHRATTAVTQVVKAPRQAVYHAFLDPDAVAAWQHPDSMRCQVQRFEAREGGEFRITLTYLDPSSGPGGKTTGDSDTYHGRFVRLVPFTTIVQVVEFESRQEAFAGEMRITVRLTDVAGGTEVTYRCENLPRGIRPADNIAGSRFALRRLAALLKGTLTSRRPSDL